MEEREPLEKGVPVVQMDKQVRQVQMVEMDGLVPQVTGVKLAGLELLEKEAQLGQLAPLEVGV